MLAEPRCWPGARIHLLWPAARYLRATSSFGGWIETDTELVVGGEQGAGTQGYGAESTLVVQMVGALMAVQLPVVLL